MITLEKEKIVAQPTVKVIKRDGRSVNFDSDKIYNALVKASNNVTKSRQVYFVTFSHPVHMCVGPVSM